MDGLDLQRLRTAVSDDAAIRRVQRLLPADGAAAKVFPPTYPPPQGSPRNAPARHIFETRRLGGQDVRCVLLDSVQSQANRLEEVLLMALREGRLGRPHVGLPHVVVDFEGQAANGIDVSNLGQVTSLDAPHRLFDAIIRDSQLDGQKFTDTKTYEKLLRAKPANALPVFELSPTSLIFGVWNSFGEGDGLGAKFSRCVVSEIVGVGATEGDRSAIRIDPLGVRKEVLVKGGRLDWVPVGTTKGKDTKRPSKIGHGNIPATKPVPGGTAIDYALHTAVISCAGLRRSRFPGAAEETAGRAVLAALALVALTEQDRSGYALRSRCDLVPDGRAPFEVVLRDGTTEPFDLDAEAANKLLSVTVAQAKEAGFPWNEQPIRLVPQQRLVQLVALSRTRALEGELEGEDSEVQ